LFFLCLAAVSIFLIYRFGTSGFDWSLFVRSVWSIQPGWLAASVVATMLTYVARAGRWQVLLNPLKPVSMGPLISTNVLGFSAIYIFGRPGELVRPVWLSRSEGIPLTASVATIIVERVLDLLMLIALFGIALKVVELPPATQHSVLWMKRQAGLIVASSAAAMVFLFLFRSKIDRIISYVPIAKVGELLKKFSEGLSFLDQPRSFGLALMHTVVVWTVIILQFWFMLLGMNFRFSISAATLIMVGTAIGSVAQIPGIGGGFQIAFAFCMTTFFGVPPEQATAASLVAWISSYVPTVAAGGFYMISHGLSLKDLRAAAPAESPAE
jgi:uncharacterized protein (TIRG00374 family)